MTGWIRSRACANLSRLAQPALIAVAMIVTGSAAVACPDWQLTGQTLTYSVDQLRSSATHSVIAGGSDRLSDCPMPGHGFVSTRPSFDLTFTGNHGARDLVFRVNASCDSVLLVNDARGQWHFDDDGGDGLNSLLRVPNAPDGVYDIWVGTYGATSCQATLTLETGAAGQPPQTLCPDPGMNGQMLSFDGQGLWSGHRSSVIAGGNIDLGACGSVPGHGHIIQGPDFTLNLTANPQAYDLEFRIEASCDPVLLVSDPSGQWHFNDDDNGLNSRLRLPRATPGLYDIWVGTYNASTCQATLITETFGGQQTQEPPVATTSIAGNWHWQAINGTVVIDANGTGFDHIGNRIVRMSGPDASNTYTLTWSHGYTDYATLSADGNHLDVVNQNGYRFTADRIGGSTTGGPATGVPSARLMAVIPDSGRDLVGRGESMAPNGAIDGLFRVAITAPGQTLTQIEMRNTTGSLSIWDTIPNTHWVGLAMVNGQAMNRPDTTVSIPMGQGETVLDYYVQQYGAVGQDGMRMTLSFASGARAVVEIPAGFTGYVPDPQTSQDPEAVGLWSINANGFVGELELDWNGRSFSGTLTFGPGQFEILQNVGFDPATGAVRFTRTLQSITQEYRGVLANNRLAGQFNQNGGGYSYEWSATRLSPAPAPSQVPAPSAIAPGGAPAK